MDERLSLYELNQQIKKTLDDAFPALVWVVAEISELKENRNGHCYLELVEKKGDRMIARARGTIWSYTYRMLKPYFETSTGERFSHGLKILVQVAVAFHPVYGLSLNIKDIDPAYTMGDMALQRKEILERLQKEGVFSMNKELDLPLVPQKIAVISSKTAAGYQDFMEQLTMNSAGIRFYTRLFEATMQGTEAAPSIIRALERIFQYDDFFDAVAIIRGGGATADLSSFDNYDLAFNVTQFPLPVITGIGHEKDDTVIDLIAHTRMKTPTAVAEFFINGATVFWERLNSLQEEVVASVREDVLDRSRKLETIAGDIQRSVSQFIFEKQNQLSRRGNQIHQQVGRFSYNRKHELNHYQYTLRTNLSAWKQVKREDITQKQQMLKTRVREMLYQRETFLDRRKDQFKNDVSRMLVRAHERIQVNEKTMRLLNPENVLKRGYTISMKEGRIVKSVHQLSENDDMETRFSDGKVKSRIVKKE